MSRRSGLGKGLNALIPTDGPAERSEETSALREVPVSSIEPNRRQPRSMFDEESLAALSESVRTLGVLQPILVREISDGQFELIAGERRWRAARRAGLQMIPAIVRDIEDMASLEQAIVENLHRQDLNPLEEAAAYHQLIEDFELTQEAAAARVGKSRSAVANLLRLLQLPPSVQKLIGDGSLSAGHAKAILGTPDRAYQEALARKVVAEDLSVRVTESLIRERAELEQRLRPVEPESGAAKKRLRPPGLLELEELLSERLDTTVKVEMSAKKGRMTIDFANLDDLERIYRIIGAG
ncbi:MAG: ParB/RepB/Spo0J family partition protein [Microthrixaceae bacterium]|nr:ParB/RepB/Spo0J family partition protein [Actinomycetota bacterium]HMS14764.1 ParB/RepB/Spo0J family partition protein [Microthrixaceae bacterium]HMT22933.1 ParB/RepB/Spo0J family partition protein [Microthrixaceae bacterium]HMT60857.1 ParB/RepB/Spo0J family partition protein [Microthrixaceae bacterium]